jgi:hypothetical protein
MKLYNDYLSSKGRLIKLREEAGVTKEVTHRGQETLQS